VILTVCRSASAVIVAGNFQSQSDANLNTTADSVPDGFSYWYNVGQLNSASAVYIGDDWVLSASHISGYTTGTTTFSFEDPNSDSVLKVGYQAVPGSFVRLTNPSGPAAGQLSDLLMYKIEPSSGVIAGTSTSYTQSPNLAHVLIATDAPVATESVLAIGRGVDRQASITTWNSDFTASTPAKNSGYLWQGSNTQALRWGQNLITQESKWVDLGGTSGQVFAMGTTFDKNGLAYEFQATSGDSGGGVFYFDTNYNSWVLAGTMEATTGLQGQPANTSVFNTMTWISDLSYYRSQILAKAPMPGDINLDTFVDIQDVTLIANHWLTAGPTGDVNHDGVVDIQDLTFLTNHWYPAPAGAGAALNGMNLSPVPEPSTVALASLGLACLLGLARRSIKQR